MARANKILDLLEGISVNYASPARFEKYLKKLIPAKFKLGEYQGEYQVGDKEVYVYPYGPVQHPLLKGKYIYLLGDFTKGRKHSSFGLIDQFAIHNKFDPSMMNFKMRGGKVAFKDGVEFKKIPTNYKKFEHAMALIVAAGSEFESFPEDGNVEIDDNRLVFDVNERFEMLAYLVNMAASRRHPGLIVVGTGGVGKTYTVTNTLSLAGLEEGSDYIFYKAAKMTTVTFYSELYDNPDKLFIFDEGEALLFNPDSLNMLKAALDLNAGRRVLTYKSVAVEATGRETMFEFTGQIIFITNIAFSQVPQPILSRVMFVDATMTKEEIIYRVKTILEKNGSFNGCTPESSYLAFDLVMEIFEKYGKPRDLNIRTFEKAAAILMDTEDPVMAKRVAEMTLSMG